MRILVTGGAGYIGLHVVSALRRQGHEVLIVDAHPGNAVGRFDGVPILTMDLTSSGIVDTLAREMAERGVEAVMHFAARKQVAESVARPAWYYSQNVGGLANLLLSMEAAAVTRLVFSSSAAVYGSADGAHIDESVAPEPINPYGESKLAGERLVSASAAAFGLRAVSLRYFNVAGAASPDLGDPASLNLVPMVFERIVRGESPLIFGADYETPDGTCVRDYIHVADLADAHTAALGLLSDAGPGNTILNVGTGIGTSVREIVTRALEVTGSTLTPIVTGRRPGDPAYVVASVKRIAEVLGWHASLGVDEMVESAWAAFRMRGHVEGPSANAR